MDKKERNFTICISITILIVIMMIISGSASADHRSNLHKSVGLQGGSDEYSNDEYVLDDNSQGINDGQDFTTE